MPETELETDGHTLAVTGEPFRKRLLDVVVSAAVLTVTSPVLLAAAIAVKVSSPGPVFYRDRRVGRNGRKFLLWKFRSMVSGANRIGWNITVEGDPRITRIGRFLRHWKIDELPNLFNVLAGAMSIVGPRPEVPEYTQYYTAAQCRILTIRPGITDLATSSAYRHEQTILAKATDPKTFYIDVVMQDKLRLNLALVDEPYSLRRDLGLVLKTIGAILSRNPAQN